MQDRVCIPCSAVKTGVLWPSKYDKIRFRPGLCPGPRCGSSWRFPRPHSRLGRGHTSPYSTQSAPTHLRRSPCVPRIPARSTPMHDTTPTVVNRSLMNIWLSFTFMCRRLGRVGSGYYIHPCVLLRTPGGDTRRKKFRGSNLQRIVEKRGRTGKKKVWGDTLEGVTPE